MPIVPIHLQEDPDDPALLLPYVDVGIAGATRRMLLDTGAARSCVRADGPLSHIATVAGSSGSGVFGGRTDVLRAVVDVAFAELQLGPMNLDLRPPEQAGAADLLGQDVLARLRCEYRPADSVVVVDGPPPARTEPLVLDEGGHVRLTVEWPHSGVSANAVFDTAASVSILDAGFHAAHQSLIAPSGSSAGTDATGARLSAPMGTMEGPVIGGRGFRESAAAVVDLTAVNAGIEHSMDVILGWPLISQSDWYFDHPGRVWGYGSGGAAS